MKDCIKKVRKNKNWTQQHLADVSGINVSVISRAERGVTKPGPETLMALEQALGTSLGIRSFGLSYKERKKFYTERGRTLSEGFQFLQFLMDNMRGKSNDKYERVAEEILSHSNLDSINKISGEKNLQTLCEAFLSLEDKGEPVRFLIMSLQDCLGLVFPEVLCIDQYISCWGAEIILLDYSPIICLGENWKPGE